ncbi:RagB/SusD family nutrient uptake outer membrane protein [Flavobacterium sp. TAB 87]|uniref:RagB/SusD family nutrient uptake outer membrane protein n=1 Tax=Flavobacterium sp. TAB 87 TaxID=1729581 RepID=UPI00076D9B8F|nr:RagB/SusD family nutrient uptake outer membrane protein [Flavobacterium sp. TAB 87]KVV15702.1 SusD family protein [Flavobacterium sp. TAB 87]
MKKYSICLLAAAFLSSCSGDFLDENPKGSLTPSNFYKTEQDFDMAQAALVVQFNGMFNQLQGPAYAADDITSKRTGNKIEFSDFDVFNATSSNNRMTALWNYAYSTIKSANSLVANYNEATDVKEEVRNNAGGMGYFMRAISYFYLTRTWGEVPMPTDTKIDENRSNAKVQEIYELMIADLQKAETMLPDHWTGLKQQNGVDIFPTKGSAKSLLASVYLNMAGWPIKDESKYALAAAKSKEVIDNSATWGYDLLPNYGDLWRIKNKFNKETVFGCYYNVNVPEYVWENGSQNGPLSTGPDFEEGGWDDLLGDITFYENFPEGPRKAATYQEEYFVKNNPNNVITWQQTQQKHPYFWKYRDTNDYDWATHSSPNWWGDATSYLIRYSDVLLIYAESQAMASGADASAYAAINKVRTRAGLANLTAGLSPKDFKDAVVAERGWEFAAEFGNRWFDLLRTETVQKMNSTRDASEAALINQADDASHKYYWAPIPFVK